MRLFGNRHFLNGDHFGFFDYRRVGHSLDGFSGHRGFLDHGICGWRGNLGGFGDNGIFHLGLGEIVKPRPHFPCAGGGRDAVLYGVNKPEGHGLDRIKPRLLVHQLGNSLLLHAALLLVGADEVGLHGVQQVGLLAEVFGLARCEGPRVVDHQKRVVRHVDRVARHGDDAGHACGQGVDVNGQPAFVAGQGVVDRAAFDNLAAGRVDSEVDVLVFVLFEFGNELFCADAERTDFVVERKFNLAVFVGSVLKSIPVLGHAWPRVSKSARLFFGRDNFRFLVFLVVLLGSRRWLHRRG